MSDASDLILDAALVHVAFDGWSEAAFRAGAEDAGIPFETARGLFPRGAVDLATAFHRRADAALAAELAEADLSQMRFRERVTWAVRRRLEMVAEHKEAVRRATTLFALPMHAPRGAGLIWETADVIWTGLGDPSRDLNWYTKRTTLSGVYGATVLFWMGDQSTDDSATWDFLDRRIEDVMRFENTKAKLRENAFLGPFARGFERFSQSVRAPSRAGAADDLPGRWPPRG